MTARFDPPMSGRAAWLIMGLGLLLGLAAGLVLFYGVPSWARAASDAQTGGPKAKATVAPAPAPVVGAPAPDFNLQDLAGNLVTLSSFKGQVVLINFWATWCGPCRIEMPALQRRYEAFKEQGFAVLAVNLDEPITDVGAFASSFGLTFPVLLDPGAMVNDLYRVRGYPTSFFVGRDGVIARQQIGVMTEGQLDDYLVELGLEN